jgi:hypothetical protein
MRDGLDTSELWIESKWGELSFCADGIHQDEKGEAAYYLASLEYYGPNYQNQLSGFISQRDCAADPTTNPEKVNFIAYLKTLGSNYLYPAQVMSRYIDAVDNKCDSDCIGAAD